MLRNILKLASCVLFQTILVSQAGLVPITAAQSSGMYSQAGPWKSKKSNKDRKRKGFSSGDMYIYGAAFVLLISICAF